MKKFLLEALLLPFLFCFFIGLSGCGTLDATGPYQGKKDLYSIDQTIGTEKAIADVFVDWEAANRAFLLATRPEVHTFAEKVRTTGKLQIQEVTRLRDVYAGDPSAANLSAFNKALEILKELLTDARTYIVTTAPTKTP